MSALLFEPIAPPPGTLEDERLTRVLSIAMHAALIAIASAPQMKGATKERSHEVASAAFCKFGGQLMEIYGESEDVLDDLLLCADEHNLKLLDWLMPKEQVIQ